MYKYVFIASFSLPGMAKEALVVPRAILFREKQFEGFLPLEAHDFQPVILAHLSYAVRTDALEHDTSLKQIISYVLIVNPRLKKIFVYRRANTKEVYSEARLWNKWSCGVGGHIEPQDDTDPLQGAAMRELQEEVKMRAYPLPRIVGFVNDEVGEVEKYHFGVVFLAETDEEEIAMGDGEIEEGRFMSVEEVERVFADPENHVERWTLAVLPFIKNYLQSL